MWCSNIAPASPPARSYALNQLPYSRALQYTRLKNNGETTGYRFVDYITGIASAYTGIGIPRHVPEVTDFWTNRESDFQALRYFNLERSDSESKIERLSCHPTVGLSD
eukprot:7444564-Pyramimonas_sp.AAC.2